MHFNRGGIFENLCLLEIKKYFTARGTNPPLAFWQNNQGREIDIILENAGKPLAIEVKSGKTYTSRYTENLEYWQKLSGEKPEDCYVIYAGDMERKTKFGTLLPWNKISRMLNERDDKRPSVN